MGENRKMGGDRNIGYARKIRGTQKDSGKIGWKQEDSVNRKMGDRKKGEIERGEIRKMMEIAKQRDRQMG